MSKISQGKKGEDKVISLLKKEKLYHKVINNATYVVGKTLMSHQIDHILIHPHGVFVIETKNYYGDINAQTYDSFWLKTIKGKTEKIANPLKQNKSHTIIVNNLLNKKYEVIPVVVFVRNNAPYFDDENVINLKDLHLFIDSYPYQKELNKEEINLIYKILKEKETKITKKEHLENIEYLKQFRRESQLEMAYAIEKRICPRCNHEMVVKDNEFFCSHCDYKFKL